jgi:hypothetical protein
MEDKALRVKLGKICFDSAILPDCHTGFMPDCHTGYESSISLWSDYFFAAKADTLIRHIEH